MNARSIPPVSSGSAPAAEWTSSMSASEETWNSFAPLRRWSVSAAELSWNSLVAAAPSSISCSSSSNDSAGAPGASSESGSEAPEIVSRPRSEARGTSVASMSPLFGSKPGVAPMLRTSSAVSPTGSIPAIRSVGASPPPSNEVGSSAAICTTSPAICSVCASSLSGTSGRGPGDWSSGELTALNDGRGDGALTAGISTVFSTGGFTAWNGAAVCSGPSAEGTSPVPTSASKGGWISITGAWISAISSICIGTIPESRASWCDWIEVPSRSTCFCASSFPGSTVRSCPDQRSASLDSPSCSARSASAFKAMTLSGSSCTTWVNASRAFTRSPMAIWTRPSTTRAETYSGWFFRPASSTSNALGYWPSFRYASAREAKRRPFGFSRTRRSSFSISLAAIAVSRL